MTDTTPHLERSLTLRSVVLFGLAYMAPMIVLGTFGVLAVETNGAVPSAYVVALVAMVFTAISYGKMARNYPVAGSAYTYTREAIDGRIGFLVGWAVLLDYFFLPMVIWLIGAAYLGAEFPGVPGWIWIVAFIAVTSLLNIIGIKTAARANLLLMVMQVLVLVLFVALSLRHVFVADGATALISAAPFTGQGATLSGIAAGAAIAAYSFLGFDAVTTLTEETIEPKKTMPKAILLVTLIGGVMFIVAAYSTQLAAPGATFDDPSSAAFEIAVRIGGDLFSSIFLAGLIIAQFASGLAAQASAARLIYAMGRDNIFPRRIFGFVHPRFHTPVFNILLTGVVGLFALFLDVATSTSFINFGAFTAFTFVNLCVIALYFKQRPTGTRGVISYLVLPAIGAAIDVWLLTNLDGKAITVGLIWLALGIVYLVWITRGFRRPPPKVNFEEAEAVS